MNLHYFINELSFRNGHHSIIILQLKTDQTNYRLKQHSTKNYNVPFFILNKNGSCIIAFGFIVKRQTIFLLCDHYSGTSTFKKHFNSRDTFSDGPNFCLGKMNLTYACITKSLNLQYQTSFKGTPILREQ